MADKFGWDEEKLFFIDNVSLQDTSGDPGAPSAAEGTLRVYASDDGGTSRLYIRDGVESILMPINAVDAAAVAGQSLIKQKNADGELEFYGIKSADGRLDIALNGDDIELTVDYTDINDDLDHGLLLGLADDDHSQYALLAGRSGGQILEGGTDASDDLELKSTDNATKGEVKITDGSDFRHSKRLWKSATVQTTDATPLESTVIFPVAEDSSGILTVKAVCRSTDETERAMFIQSQAVYRDTAGAATLQGNHKSQHKTRTNGELEIHFNLPGDNTIKVQVDQNDMTETVDWAVEAEYVEYAP